MQVTAMDVYRLLPKTNCGKCNEASCMAFATKLIEKEVTPDDCPPLSGDEKQKLEELLAPAVKEITFGPEENPVVVGGDEVLYRYELTYYNPTALVVDLPDDLPSEELLNRAQRIMDLEFERTGEKLTLDAIALRNKSGSPEKFAEAAEAISQLNFPVVLCTFDAEAMRKALEVLGDQRPLLYAAREDNLQEMADLSASYGCPLALFSPGDLEEMKNLSRRLRSLGVTEIVLDPGTFTGEGIGDTIDNFVMIRRLAVEDRDEDFRFPIMGIPALSRLTVSDKIEANIREATVAATLMNRYADILILAGTEIWEIMPVLTLRQGLYTDPRKPQAVDPGVYEFGDVDENSPVILTTNFSLTYYTVEGDIKSGDVTAYLLVLDTEGRAVDVSLAGGQLNGPAVADLIKETGIEERVRDKVLIIPGLAAPASGEIEDDTGWKVLVGPRDSSGIPDYLEKLASE